MLNHLSLFSGYEGFGLGLRLAGLPIRTVGYVEIDDYCQRVLQTRMADGVLDNAPIIRDITACDFRPMAGLVDIITAGFPCQPHSIAGARAGAADPRNLWPDTARCVGEVGPRYVLLENVPGLIANGYGGVVVGQLAEMGYGVRWGVVSAAEAGAPHLRKRWWCLAYADGTRHRDRSGKPCRQVWNISGRAKFERRSRQMADATIEGLPDGGTRTGGSAAKESERCCGDVADANGQREPELQGSISDEQRRSGNGGAEMADASGIQDGRCGQPRGAATGVSWWQVEPALGRVVDGCPDRVASIRTLGNGIVPAVVAEFLRELAK